jgi:hypothetical protein
MSKRPWQRPDVRELRAGSAEELVTHIAVVMFKAPKDNRFNERRFFEGAKAGTRIREPFEPLACFVTALHPEDEP